MPAVQPARSPRPLLMRGTIRCRLSPHIGRDSGCQGLSQGTGLPRGHCTGEETAEQDRGPACQEGAPSHPGSYLPGPEGRAGPEPDSDSAPDAESGQPPLPGHPLLDREGLLPGRAELCGHLHHAAGRLPGRQPRPAPGGPEPRVRHLPRLLQAGHHVSSGAPSKGVDVVHQRGNAKAGKPAQKALREMRVEAKLPFAPVAAAQLERAARTARPRGDGRPGAPCRGERGLAQRSGGSLLRPLGRPHVGVTQRNSHLPRPPGAREPGCP